MTTTHAPVLDCTVELIPHNGACTEHQCMLYHNDPRACLAETRAFKAKLRQKNPKPDGYTWRLWHDAGSRDPKPLPRPGIYPAWAWGTPAKLVASILAASVNPGTLSNHATCLREFRAGTHPWQPATT